MTNKELIDELSTLEYMAIALKDQAARLKVKLAQLSEPAPKGVNHFSHPLTEEEIKRIISKRRARIYKKAAELAARTANS